jgi:N-acetylmuramoyl-L-alanine amidase
MVDEEQDEIRNEIMYGEVEELAILIYAEAGNQDELGKRYVADCVLNRVDNSTFPETIHDVIYQINPVQFSTIKDGSYEEAEYDVTEDCFTIALEEYENRTNTDIIYFRTDHYSECGKPAFKHGNHYFSTGG